MNRSLASYSSHTEFSVTSYSDQYDDLAMHNRACFGAFVRHYPRNYPLNVELKIRVYNLNGPRNYVGEENNNLIVGQDGIERQLKRMRELYYFTYEIKAEEDNDYVVSIKGNMYAMQWKLILTIFRQIYEYPYNVVHFILDKWLQEDKLTDISYISAFNLLAQTMGSILTCGIEDGLTFNNAFSLPVSNEVLKERVAKSISREEFNVLNLLFEFAQNEDRIILPDYNYTSYRSTTLRCLYSKDRELEYGVDLERNFSDLGIKWPGHIPKPLRALHDAGFKKINEYSRPEKGGIYKYPTLNNLDSSQRTSVDYWSRQDVQDILYEAVMHNKDVLQNYMKNNE